MTVHLLDYIYILGIEGRDDSLVTFYRYDIVKKTRSSLMPPLNRRFHPAVCLKGNCIVLCGGSELDSCEVYSTELNA